MPEKPDFGLGDKKLQKIMKKAKDGPDPMAAYKASGKQAKERDREEKDYQKRAHAAAAARSKEKTPWIRKLGGVLAIFVLCGAGAAQVLMSLFSGLSGSGLFGASIEGPFKATETAKLKEILFGGDPYLVYCINDDTSKQKLPKFVEDCANEVYSEGVKTALLPCWDKMESGKTLAERFKFRNQPPVMFTVANGDAPKLVNMQGMQPADVAKQVTKTSKPKLELINGPKVWSKLCTSRRACVAFGYKHIAQVNHIKNVLDPILPEFKSLKFVQLDTEQWKLKLDLKFVEKRPDSHTKKGPALFCLAKGGGNTTYAGWYPEGDFNAYALRSFLSECKAAPNGMPDDFVEIAKAPKIEARPKKAKIVTPPPYSGPSPPPPTPAPQKPKSRHADYVGSRAKMEENTEKIVEDADEEDIRPNGIDDTYIPEEGEEEPLDRADEEDAEEVEI